MASKKEVAKARAAELHRILGHYLDGGRVQRLDLRTGRWRFIGNPLEALDFTKVSENIRLRIYEENEP